MKSILLVVWLFWPSCYLHAKDWYEGLIPEVYSTEGGLTKADREQRSAYMKKADFAILPQFSRDGSARTDKYRGICYEVDGGFVVVEPIIDLMGGIGYFADKAARVSFVDKNGIEKVLYRAADHWKSLKPPGLTWREVQSRQARLAAAGGRAVGMDLAEVLGESDSTMGSGVDYQLYYMDNALAIAMVDDNQRGEVKLIRAINFWRPGARHLTFEDWLANAKTKVK